MAEDHGSAKKSSGYGWPIVVGLLVVGVALQFLAPGESHGGGEHHGFVFSQNGFYIFDFIVLVVALVWFVRSPMRQFLRQRRATIEREIDEARRLQAEAQETLETYRKKLAGLDAEVEGIKIRARQDGEVLKQKIIAEGQETARRLLEDAEARVRQETYLLRERLESELIVAAVERAEELLQAGLSADKQRQFVRDYVDQIEAMASAGTAGRA